MSYELLLKQTISEVMTEQLKDVFFEIQELKEENKKLSNKISSLLKKSNPQELLTVKEVAEIMKVKETTVRDWLRKDLISYEKTGQNYRITRAALENYKRGN